MLRYLIERYAGILFSSDLFIVCPYPLLLYVNFLMKKSLAMSRIVFFCNNSMGTLSKDFINSLPCILQHLINNLFVKQVVFICRIYIYLYFFLSLFFVFLEKCV